MAQHHVEILNHVSEGIKQNKNAGFICLILKFDCKNFSLVFVDEILETVEFAINLNDSQMSTFQDHMMNIYPEFYSEETSHNQMKTDRLKFLHWLIANHEMIGNPSKFVKYRPYG